MFISALFFALALLLKPFSAFYAVPVIYMAFKKFGFKKAIINIPILLSLDIALIPFLLWRAWINDGAHIIGVPFYSWLFNGDGIRFRPSFWRWIFGIRLGQMILGTWGLPAFFIGVIASIKKNKVIAFLLLGMLLYVTAVATANVRHDYYQTFIIPAVCLSLAFGFVAILKSSDFPKFYSFIFLTFSIGMMFLSARASVQ